MKHRETRIVPYSADLMFRVVADVESYPKFLPWVTGARILAREGNALSAEMSVGFARFTESYVSRVILDPAARAIGVTQIHGPFRVLENHWKFVPEGSGCRIDFSVAFEFRNPALNLVAGTALDRVTRRMADAFVERARVVSEQSG